MLAGAAPIIVFGIYAAPFVVLFAYLRELWQRGLFSHPVESAKKQFNSANSWRDIAFWELGVLIAMVLIEKFDIVIFLAK